MLRVTQQRDHPRIKSRGRRPETDPDLTDSGRPAHGGGVPDIAVMEKGRM